MQAQLGDTTYGTIKVMPSLDTCSANNFLAIKFFNTIPKKEKYVIRKQNITVCTGSGKESTLAYYCKLPLHTKDSKGRHYIFNIPVWVVQFLNLGSNFIRLN